VPYPIPSPLLVSRLQQAIRGADVVHCHGFLNASTTTAFTLARAQRAPVRLLTEHVGHVQYASKALNIIEATAIRTMGRLNLGLAEGTAFLNDRVERELRRLAPTAALEWIPNGVDVSRYSPAGEEERARLRHSLGWDSTPRVLLVGRLVAKKGVEVALDVAARSRGRFEVVFVGPGERRPDANGARFLGALTVNELIRVYQAADAFLLPSFGEGFPMTAQEALACGLPTFLGEDPAYARYVAASEGALRTVPREASAIEEALSQLLADPAKHLAERQAARKYAERAFSWSRAADEYLAFADRLRHARR
jgi:glycosyltransferase involved in cell wall biosynthesis